MDDEFTPVIEWIDRQLQRKSLPQREFWKLQGERATYNTLRELRSEIVTLKRHDVIAWYIQYPRIAWALSGVVTVGLLLFAPYFWNLRRYVIQFVWYKVSGHNLPLEAIP